MVADHLIQIRDESKSKYLPGYQDVLFHHTTTNLILLSVRAQREIQTYFAFLTTRFNNLDKDDLVNFKQLLEYLRGTKYMKFTLSVESLEIFKRWVDWSYNTNDYFKGRASELMYIEIWVYTKFLWGKNNFKSSTEFELKGPDDTLPVVLWGKIIS